VADVTRRSDWRFVAVAALLFVTSAAATVAWCRSMPAHCAMPMPGGWTLSMTWMPMPGQSWPGAAAAFLAMWTVMMPAMMLPVLMPLLRRYRDALAGVGAAGQARLTVVAGTGYFVVWIALGIVVFPLGAALAALVLSQPGLSHAVPIALAAVVVAAGAVQFTDWKARRLACGRHLSPSGRAVPLDARTAWRHGVELGVHCSQCCANLMAILLAVGVMDLAAMAVVTAAIAAERLAPAGERVARAIGTISLAAGAMLAARATWLA
jgi:predicted metal-binding membrane protein